MFCSILFAQGDVSFEASVSKERLGQNERLRLEFKMNKNGDDFSPPSFEEFQVIQGPSQQVSHSWMNGKSSFNKSYTYILKPIKQGKFTIGTASIVIDGKTYTSQPITIKVTAPVNDPNAPKTVDDIANESVYLVAQVSNTSPYVNEPINVAYKLYYRDVEVTGSTAKDSPEYEGFGVRMCLVRPMIESKLLIKESNFSVLP